MSQQLHTEMGVLVQALPAAGQDAGKDQMLQALYLPSSWKQGCTEQHMHSVEELRDVGSCVQLCAPSSFFSTAVKPPMSSLASSSARLKALSLASAEAYLTTPLGAPCKGASSHPSMSQQDLSLSVAILSELSSMLAEVPHWEASGWASRHRGHTPGNSEQAAQINSPADKVHTEGSTSKSGWGHGAHPGELDETDAPGVASGEALLDIAVVQVMLCWAQVEAQQQALLELRLLLCFRLCPCIRKPGLRSGCCSTNGKQCALDKPDPAPCLLKPSSSSMRC